LIAVIASLSLEIDFSWGMQVSLFSENSSRWLVADQAIMLNGAADAVRDFFILFLERGGNGLEGRYKEMLYKLLVSEVAW
jgi:hypothetical protein